MKLDPKQITPALMIINEEYWIHYVLRDLLTVFDEVIVFDTGSEDRTLDLIGKTLGMTGGKLTLLKRDCHGDANLIGQNRNLMRERVKTHWMFLVDGDEIWRVQQLRRMFEFEVPDETEVVMVGAAQVQDVNGTLQLREHDWAHRDGLFAPSVRWNRLEYPFEGHDLHERLARGVVSYLPARVVFEYHMRHTLRSGADKRTFMREAKLGYFKYTGTFVDLPEDWLGEVCKECPNPYLSKIV